MSIFKQPPFDPTVNNQGFINNQLPNLVGFMIVNNDTPANIVVQVGARQVRVLSGHGRRLNIPPGDGANATEISWYTEAIQSNSGQYPTIVYNGQTMYAVLVEEYTWDEDENFRETYPITIPRTQNVGNTVATSSVQTLVNDGNIAATGVIEATPAGGSSSLGFRNDGSGYFGGGQIVFNASGIFTAMPAQAIPLTALKNGTLPSGITAVNATNATTATQVSDGSASGVLAPHDYPTGNMVRLGVGQIASVPRGFGTIAWNGTTGINVLMVDSNGVRYADSMPATGLTGGILPAGVTINPASINAGALPAGVTIPAGQVTSAPWLPTAGGTMTGLLTMNNNITLGTSDNIMSSEDTNLLIGKGGYGDNNDFGIFTKTTTSNIVLQSASKPIYLKYNNYFDGTADRFITANPANRLVIDNNGVRFQWSTNAPVADGTITWGTAYPLLGADYGAAAHTYTNWPAGSIVWINSSI